MTKTNTDFILKEWIPALRSGAYQQGRAQLACADGSFCCLGVAADLLVKKGELGPWETQGEYSGFYLIHDGLDYGGALPPDVADAIGISGHDQSKLVLLNDQKGASFGEIADYLEALVERRSHVEAA